MAVRIEKQAKSKSNTPSPHIQILSGALAPETETASEAKSNIDALIGKGVNFTSDEEGKITIKSESMESLGDILGGGSGITPSDLAGLTSRDVSRALAGATDVSALKQRTIAEVMRNQTLQQRNAVLAYNAATRDQRSVVKKNYDTAVNQGYEGSLIDFMQIDKDPNSFEEFNLAVADGYEGTYPEWLEHMAVLRRSQINIGQREEEKILGKEKGRSQTAGWHSEIWEEIVEKDYRFDQVPEEVNPEKYKFYISKGRTPEQAKELVRKHKLISGMDKRLRSIWGPTLDMRQDGWYLGDRRIQVMP